MEFRWASNTAKAILYALIATMVFTLVAWGIIWVNSSNIVQDRVSDLTYIASTENCLSDDGTNSVLDDFEKLLKNSETSWLKFKTNIDGTNIKYSDGLGYYVGNNEGTREYYSYLSAPQRGGELTIKVRGTLTLPLMIIPDFMRPNLTVNIVKEYHTMGMKFYKGKI